MQLLEQRILTDGIVGENDVLKVGSFLNQQIDTQLLRACAEEFCRLFQGSDVTKVLTVEASGIAIATATAMCLGVPFVFAKKSKTNNISGDVYSADAYSYTHNTANTVIVPCTYLSESDKVLIVDDFLADGQAAKALIDLVKQAGGEVVGIGIAIEKGQQQGGIILRKAGYKLESIAIIESMDYKTQNIVFRQKQ